MKHPVKQFFHDFFRIRPYNPEKALDYDDTRDNLALVLSIISAALSVWVLVRRLSD